MGPPAGPSPKVTSLLNSKGNFNYKNNLDTEMWLKLIQWGYDMPKIIVLWLAEHMLVLTRLQQIRCFLCKVYIYIHIYIYTYTHIYSIKTQSAVCTCWILTRTLTLRWLMSYIYIYIYIYIYGAPILDVSRSHTTTQHSR